MVFGAGDVVVFRAPGDAGMLASGRAVLGTAAQGTQLAGVLDAAVTKLRSERDDVAASLALKQKQLDMLLARV